MTFGIAKPSAFERMLVQEERKRYLEHRVGKVSMLQEEIAELSSYLLGDKCTDDIQRILAHDFTLPTPRKVTVRKTQSNRRRTLFVYPPRQRNLFSYLTWELYEYDDLYSGSLYSFRREKKLLTMFDQFYVVNRRTDGDYQNMNFDIAGDWDNLSFWYDPAKSVRITLNGMTLDSAAIDFDNDRILITCPITLNGERTNLRIARVKDGEGETSYEVLGTWSGINDIGFAGRYGEQLHKGDVVGAVSLATDKERETVKITNEPIVEEAALEPGTYECHFVSCDLHGNVYPSNNLAYEVTADGRTVVTPTV